MSTEELTRKIVEVLIVSGSLVVWDAIDPILEAQLLSVTGPLAPYLAATLSAIGFGLSSYYLQEVVTKIIDFTIRVSRGHQESVAAQREAFEQMIAVSERNFELVEILGEFADSSRILIADMAQQTAQLRTHQPVGEFDIQDIISIRRDTFTS